MPRDPFDDFKREMHRRTVETMVQDAAERVINSKTGKYTEAQLADRAVLSAMKDIPLQRGQMLLLGPQSVRLLTTPGAFAGSLPDKHILDKSEWGVVG